MIRRWLHAIRQRFEPKAYVLMYHRVDEPEYDPWQLAVSPAHFEQQLQVLRQHWNPISLAELSQAIATRSVPDRSVVLTFDDGYIDNFEQAKPLLEKYNVPATFFIATQNCERQTLFWWDELQQIIFETETLPPELALPIGTEQVEYRLADEVALTGALRERQRGWIAFENEPTQRCAVYLELWSRLRLLPDQDQQRTLAQLRQWANRPSNQQPGLVCMTPEHINQLISNPLFTVGAHTVTHPALSDHSAAQQREEIGSSQAYLEKLTGRPIQLFAYPYGKFSDETVAVADALGFAAAVTTHEGPITRFSQPLRLNRFQVNNWGSDEFQINLTGWSSSR